MADIHRLYCTHCTFGTSVLEKRTTENAARVLGYSVRAASGDDREKIRRVFRAIERLLSYDLPKGTPPTAKLTYDAAKAPRRLVFMPRLNDHQVVGLMSYRSQDTAGRPGSYFGDFLVARTGATRSGDWSAVDCLRLWPASHTGEIVDQWWCDSEERVTADEAAGVSPIAPETLSSVSGPGIISDKPFLSFLSAEIGASFEDPGQVIPPRWAEVSAADRQLLFVRLSQATVDALTSGKGNVTLVVEPSLAALLFYGVCRILPRRLLAATGLSFSTYDPSPDRATTTLVATVCNGHGVDGDLPGEAYKRGFVCNTFTPGFRYGAVTEPGKYVAHVVECLQREGRIPDELIGEYDALPDLSIAGIDALPALVDDIVRYLRGADPLARYPQLTEKAAGALTPAGKSLRAALVRKRLESLSSPYPPDLLEVVVDWLGNELAGDWKAQGPLYRALQPILPSNEEDLEALIQQTGSKLPHDIRHDVVIKVTLATGVLPKTVALMAACEKSTSKAGDALRRTIERVGAERAEMVEGVLKNTIERHTNSFLPLIAKNFDTLASIGQIEDRRPLAGLLLKKAFPSGKLKPSEKWAILDSCFQSKPTPIPDEVWDDTLWCEDHLEECFRGVRTRGDLDRRARIARDWAKMHDCVKSSGTPLESLIDPWRKLVDAVDALRDGKNQSKEQSRLSGLAIVAAATELVQDRTSTWQPSDSEIGRICDRALSLRCTSDADKQRLGEIIVGVQREVAARKQKQINVARWRHWRTKWTRSANELAQSYAVPIVVSIGVIAILGSLVAFLPRYLPRSQPETTAEQNNKARLPEKSLDPKPKQQHVVDTSPAADGTVTDIGSVNNGDSEISNAARRNKSVAAVDVSANSGVPQAGQLNASVPGNINAPEVPNSAASPQVVFPLASPTPHAQDTMELIAGAVRDQSHMGRLTTEGERIDWGKAGSPLSVQHISITIPSNDSFWSPDNIRIEGQGGIWRIEPNIATISMDGNGVTVKNVDPASPFLSRANLLPIIIGDMSSPQQWTWIERRRRKPVEFHVGVNERSGVVVPVEVPSVYELRDKATLVVTPLINNSATECNIMEVVPRGPVREGTFVLRSGANGREYPVMVRCAAFDSKTPEALLCRVYCYVGYFGVRDGDSNPLRKCLMSTKLASKKWVGDCASLMQKSELWGNIAREGEYKELLKEAFLSLETVASGVVSQKANCLSFLAESIGSRVTSTTQQEKGSKGSVNLQDTVHYSLESRMQSLKSVLQSTSEFRRMALGRLRMDINIDSFPLTPDKNAVSAAVADEGLAQRIADVEARWREFFVGDDEAFREWCWSAVCNSAAGEAASQVRLLAALWLAVNDSREDAQRQEQEGRSTSELLRHMQLDLDIALQIRWFPKDWGGAGDQSAKVTPWTARGRVNLGAVHSSLPPAASAETKAGASGTGPQSRGTVGNVPGPTGDDAP